MEQVCDKTERRFRLVVSGEARRHVVNLQKLLGSHPVDMYNAADTGDLMTTVQEGRADAVVVDSEWGQQDVLKVLRMIRRVNAALPVVLVAQRTPRRFMEGALRLAAFSIVHKPIEREELLIQLQRLVDRFYGQ